MPIFVGDNADGSRIRSNRVGLAVSTANPGSASEGDVYYNSTDSQIKSYDGSSWNAEGAGGGGSVELVASGTLSNGQAVILTSDGKVSGITSTSGDASQGSEQQFRNGYTSGGSGVYIGNNKVVIGYTDYGANTAHVLVGTISGTSISFGSPTQLHDTGSTGSPLIVKVSSSKVLIAYSRAHGYVVVGSISGSSISLGTYQRFSDESQQNHYTMVYASNDSLGVIAWDDHENGEARTISISGTNITLNPITTFQATEVKHCCMTYDSDTGKVVIFYSDEDRRETANAIVGTISGTNISFGKITNFDVDGGQYFNAAYDPDTKQHVCIYNSNTGSDNIGICGKINGTSISFGEKSFLPFQFSDNLFGGSFAYPLAYDSNAKRFVFTIYGSGRAEAVFCEVVGDKVFTRDFIIFRNRTYSHTVTTNYAMPTYDFDNQKIIVSYGYYLGGAAGYYGGAMVLTTPYTNSTLTSENFLGFSNGAYSNGQTATIQIAGIVDDAQSGLTPGEGYFVQGDGTLNTNADEKFRVFAGTALSSSKIHISK